MNHTQLLKDSFQKIRLGLYDYANRPLLINRRGEFNYGAVADHEQSHEGLANRSVLGVAILSYKLPENVHYSYSPELVTLLHERCRFVQEALATYNEYYNRLAWRRAAQLVRQLPPNERRNNEWVLHVEPRPVDINTFVNSLPPFYHAPFNSSRRIESIITARTITGLDTKDVMFLRVTLLLDIARYSMSFPFLTKLRNTPTDNVMKRARALLDKNDPTMRWNVVLDTLSNDREVRESFLEKATPMFRTWLKKNHGAFDGKFYTGITYAENLEKELSNSFPHLEYRNVAKEVPKKRILGFGRPEKVSAFLSRSARADMEFAPLIEVLSPVVGSSDALLEYIRRIDTDHNHGCYIKVIAAPDVDRVLEWSPMQARVVIPRQHSLVLVHPCDFLPKGSKRVLRYLTPALAFWTHSGIHTEIAALLKDDDSMMCVDVETRSALNRDLLHELSSCQVPTFVHPTPRGSFDATWAVLENRAVHALGADAFAMVPERLWRVNRSVAILYLVPRVPRSNVTIMSFGPIQHVLSAIQVWRQERSNSPVTLVDDVEIKWLNRMSTLKGKHSRRAENGWEFNPQDKILWGPGNTDAVYAHMLDFGF